MNFTSPIQEVSMINNNRIFMKREDLLPFSFGGNKVRIALEYFDDMENENAQIIISYGSIKSNLNRAISNMAVKRGKKCYIVSPEDELNGKSFNKELSEMFGANIVQTRKENVSETLRSLLEKLKKEDRNAYYIYGDMFGNGKKNIPIKAYQKVFKEIISQEMEMNISFDKVFVAVGTGSTLSGLILGAAEIESYKEFIGISIARENEENNRNIEAFLKTSLIEKHKLESVNWNIKDDFLCGGYGKFNSDLINNNIKLMSEDGIPLDSTYTGKAFWGMRNYIVDNNIEGYNILFIHTGGTPLFFDEL